MIATHVVAGAFLKEMEKHAGRLEKLRSIIKTDEQKQELLKRFEKFLAKSDLLPKTKDWYRRDAAFILAGRDEDVVRACSHVQNTRTVLKHLVNLAQRMELQEKKKKRKAS
ncbi:MAG: hypothetical protein P3W91_003035 [Fervidobacterium sp.]|nr:hypothetical protein [Fervidobacterium sp.]